MQWLKVIGTAFLGMQLHASDMGIPDRVFDAGMFHIKL